ncbi:MAG: hypothetical protein CMJ19_04095 [Phycisphaeraceae bacterium]|nr:hypothetical protein [Phycisphaeraceae bacterium]
MAKSLGASLWHVGISIEGGIARKKENAMLQGSLDWLIRLHVTQPSEFRKRVIILTVLTFLALC